MIPTLRTLLDRVEKGEGADRYVDACLELMLTPELGEAPWTQPSIGRWVDGFMEENVVYAGWYTASIDAAMALVDKMLPDWGRLLYWNNCQGHTARLEDNANEYTGSTGAEFEARGATAPLALLTALLRAKIAQEEGA